ncbi:glycoside hydrolase family 99-like domain-containing protein [Parvibaculum sedimenti]|nr:glycoside hydrolase family 99-like domain-containing protein [Parvibaculum sedimenti]
MPTKEIYSIQGLTDPDDVIHLLANITSTSSSELTVTLTERDGRIASLNQAVAAQAGELRETLSRSETELSEAWRRAEALKRHLDTERETARRAEDVAKGLGSELETSRKQIGDLREALQQSGATLAEAGRREEALRTEVKAAEARAAELREALQQSGATLVEAGRREEAFRAEAAEAGREKEEAETKLARLEEHLAGSEAALAEAGREKEEAETKLARLEEQLAGSEAEWRLLDEAFEQRNADYHRIYHALRHARARPFKTLRRFLRWKSSSALLACRKILPESVVRRMYRRMEKSSPVPAEQFLIVEAPVRMRPKRTRKMERKYRTSRFILRFRWILPKGFARRMRSRMEKSAPPSYASPVGPDLATAKLLPAAAMPPIAGRQADSVPISARPAARGIDVRAIAFYLPQFHPIPENDAWWGKGFTEWTNVTKAVPQFPGHYHPKLPGELGFYDLRLPEVQQQQIDLARRYGIHGFCFHYYWFTGGRRLLERPLNQFLAHKELDFPFCICWANENWTRRWDGSEQEILMEQRYEPQDDLEIIRDMEPLLRDPRYIRIDGRPVIIVYRVNVLPNAKRTAQIWRDYCAERGIGVPYLIAAQSFGIDDPRVFGFDAAVEFPPHGVALEEVEGIKPFASDYDGKVYSYERMAKSSVTKPWPDYTLFRTASPSWDNEARRPGRGHVYFGSTPTLYREWFSGLCRMTRERYGNPDERLVFINAWNEWAEGAYLEPDRRYGYAYLEATREALETTVSTVDSPDQDASRLVLVSHDALPYGAQFLAINIAKTLKEEFGRNVDIVLLAGGPLKAEFARWGTVHDLTGTDSAGAGGRALIERLGLREGDLAICNTTVAGHFLALLKEYGVRTVSLVHEFSGVIAEYELESAVRSIAKAADRIVFPAPMIAEGFERIGRVDDVQRVIRPQGLYKRNRYRSEKEIAEARRELRRRLGLRPETRIVLAVGHVSLRKATDLFVQAAMQVLQKRPDVFFLWLGPNECDLTKELRRQIEAAEASSSFGFPGVDADTDLYYAGADLYAMTSREDPFPSVIMEAMDSGLPVVAFDGAVGNLLLVLEAKGAVVPQGDVDAYSRAILEFLGDERRSEVAREAGRALVARDFSFRRYVHDLLALGGQPPYRVSVIVPNYNYARILADRISTIAAQTYPIYELLVLDDASTDDSLEVAKASLADLPFDARIIPNEQNSGSVFRQWLRGVEEAAGDYVWIAEADDLSEDSFLAEVIAAFSDPDVVMSYCQSKQMGPDGRILSGDYLDYVADISPERWRSPYVVEGRREICEALSIKNTIPNVSGVVFRRDALLKVLRTHCEEIAAYRIAGDWLAYTLLLEHGKVAFSPKSLNLHRRHQTSVTQGSNQVLHLAEIVSVQERLRGRYGELTSQSVKANAYAQEIYEQFELRTERHPDFSSQPEMVELVSRLLG